MATDIAALAEDARELYGQALRVLGITVTWRLVPQLGHHIETKGGNPVLY